MDEKLKNLSETYPIVLFDGKCGLCDASVQMLLKLDRARRLRYVPLQDERIKEEASKVSDNEGNYFSMLVLYQGKIYTKSRAVIEIGKRVPLLKPFSFAASWLWNPFFDSLYGFIAERRTLIWKNPKTCRTPNAGEKELFP